MTIRVSTFCSGGSCVGVETTRWGVAVHNTATPRAAPLHFAHDEWADFIAGVKAGEFDAPAPEGSDG